MVNWGGVGGTERKRDIKHNSLRILPRQKSINIPIERVHGRVRIMMRQPTPGTGQRAKATRFQRGQRFTPRYENTHLVPQNNTKEQVFTFLRKTVFKVRILYSITFTFKWLSSKESACHAGDIGSIPASWRPPGEEKGNPLQHSCLGDLMDREAWWAKVYGCQRVGHDLATT